MQESLFLYQHLFVFGSLSVRTIRQLVCCSSVAAYNAPTAAAEGTGFALPNK